MPLTLGQIAHSVSDVPIATAFFRDEVGLDFLFSAGPNLSFFDLGGVRLMVAALEPGQKAGHNSVLYFKTSSITDMFSKSLNWLDEPHLIAKMPDHELWMVFFHDPDGNTLGFMEER